MKTGPFTPQERLLMTAAARKAAKDREPLGEVVAQVSKRLDRSAVGVRLFMARAVAAETHGAVRREKRSATAGDSGRRRPLSTRSAALKARRMVLLAREIKDLGDRSAQLASRLSARRGEFERLRDELSRLVVEAPEPAPAEETAQSR